MREPLFLGAAARRLLHPCHPPAGSLHLRAHACTQHKCIPKLQGTTGERDAWNGLRAKHREPAIHRSIGHQDEANAAEYREWGLQQHQEQIMCVFIRATRQGDWQLGTCAGLHTARRIVPWGFNMRCAAQVNRRVLAWLMPPGAIGAMYKKMGGGG